MHPQISVIICTHNPSHDRLSRVLRALQAQTLQPELWDLLLIDNASETPVTITSEEANRVPIRVVREEELGLTPARLRGIRESKGELLVIVDDDNVLADDYLEAAIDVAAKHPHIGAFGGSIRGEFETPPPEWIGPYLSGLAVCEIGQNYWSNVLGWSLAVPYGAGMCVRRSVGEDYARKVMADPRRKALDRKGRELGAGGDGDLAWCAIDLGMGTGRFCSLRLTHLIPSCRLTQQYIVRLYAGFAGSGLLLQSLRSGGELRRERAWVEIRRLAWRLLRASRVDRRILLASRREREKAWKLLSLGR